MVYDLINHDCVIKSSEKTPKDGVRASRVGFTGKGGLQSGRLTPSPLPCPMHCFLLANFLNCVCTYSLSCVSSLQPHELCDPGSSVHRSPGKNAGVVTQGSYSEGIRPSLPALSRPLQSEQYQAKPVPELHLL